MSRFPLGISRRTSVAVLTVLFLSFFSTLSIAQSSAKPGNAVPKSQPAATAAPSPLAAHPLTADDIGAFFDGMIPLEIKRDDIAGAVVCVVKDGRVLFARGYGYADVKSKKPVSADDTLFRPGSISKLFTWTAVMQLVEQGKINLDADVNNYLDFKIPPLDGKPITMRDLMTHTPGFEETVKDLIQTGPNARADLPAYIKAHLPARIFAPGTMPAYSNYGAGLAGYIVQRVSGVPFDQYIEDNIFKPLGMTRSTFRQPLPDSLKGLMSSGYLRASDGAKPFEIVNPAPAGALSISATDIAHFMIAQLSGGQYDGARILQSQTVELMHSRQFGLDPSMNGMALGFYEESRNGHRIIGHGGDTVYFHSDLHLVPDQNLGFFISYNSVGRTSPPRSAVWNQFLDRYLPYQEPVRNAPATAVADAQSVAGSYMTTRRFETSIMRLASLQTMSVDAQPDGTLVVDGFKGLDGKPRHWREIGHLEYQDVDGQARIAFKSQPGSGELMMVDFPAVAFQRVPWYHAKTFLLIVLVFVIAVLTLALILWPVSALVRRHYRRPLELIGAVRRTRLVVRLVALLQLAVLVAWLVFFALSGDRMSLLSSRSDGLIHTIQVFAVLGVLSTLFALMHFVSVWTSSQLRVWMKLLESAVVLACIGYVWIAVTWNMLQFHLHY